MGIRKMITRAADRAAGGVSKLASLSQSELESIAVQQEIYLSQLPDPQDPAAEELTRRLLAAGSIRIFNAYLDQLKELYVPVQHSAEYDGAEFDASRNIRWFNITRWAVDRNENSLEKLVNVYQVLSGEDCNIALIFQRTEAAVRVWLAVTNTANADNNVSVNLYRDRLKEAIRGNFPGAEIDDGKGAGTVPCLDNNTPFSAAVASNVPTEKSEKFVSQTIEKLLDGIVPDSREKEYIIILMATPIRDAAERRLELAQLYSALAPYAGWSTNFTYNESSSTGAAATVGVNVGVSAGIQNGTNQTYSVSSGTTDSSSDTTTESSSEGTSESTGTSTTESTSDTATDTVGSSTSSAAGSTQTTGTSYTEGTSTSTSTSSGTNISITGTVSGNIKNIVSLSGGVSAGGYSGTSSGTGTTLSSGTTATSASSVTKTVGQSVSTSAAKTVGKAVASTAAKTVSSTVGRSVASTLGKAVSNTVSTAAGAFQSFSLGGNFGASFARTSSVTAVIGKNEGITQNFTNYSVKHALELLESQMKRLEQSTALGMWDFAAYFLSEDPAVASNAAHTYLALTQGEESYLSQASVNLWRGDRTDSEDAREICSYLRELRHPVFGLNPDLIRTDPDFQLYPAVVTAAAELSGKELACSLNFPQHSVPGLPVMECTAFGRNVITYGAEERNEPRIHLGQIFHMNRAEGTPVDLSLQSLASHTFVTGSTGTGKSNAVFQLLGEAAEQGIRFLVIEPAKGEYKHVFGNNSNVSVYGTNPALTPLLRINPFRFPKGIHILEHLDRLVEIFNACWPMYAAMPAVLKNAMERAYADCGWDLYRSVNELDPELYPTFADVARNIREIMDESEYDAENKGAYKGSLLTRLQSLTNGINGMIFTCDDIADADLFDRNVIIDLSRVGSTETKSLLMGLLVLKLQEHRMSSAGMNEPLRHLTVLEEAHNLLRRTSGEQGPESANLQGKSVELLANAIAEMRTYGEGFIIADQAPGLLDPAVIRNTNTKIILRLPDQGDRELAGGAANLNPDQIQALAQIPRGVAAVWQNEWMQPVLCRIDRFDAGDARYVPDPERNPPDPDPTGELAARELLNMLLQQELYARDNHAVRRRIRKRVLRSKLDGGIKKDLVRCLQADREDDSLPALSRLVYDLTNAGAAVAAAANCRTPETWREAVTAALRPGPDGLTQQQMDLLLGLILCEQSLRDPSYEDLLVRYTELYQQKKEVR